MFPDGRNPWAEKYKRASVPITSNSFRVTIKKLQKKLATAESPFGPDVPPKLVERFRNIMEKRAHAHPFEQQTAFWDNPRKLIAAGLFDYCGLNSKEVYSILNERFGYKIGNAYSLRGRRREWINNREFPYERMNILRVNNPMLISFVDYLRSLTGMSLQDVRDIVLKTRGEKSMALKDIDTFIDIYEKFHTTEQSNSTTSK